jgi:3-hydroxyisobutyrate dehydrogenase-like beta-hydroxyacid dehydrogenase
MVAVIGLGRMGTPMARNLMAVDHALIIHDIRPEATATFAADGVSVAGSPAEATRDAGIVLTCLPGPAEVAAVMDGADGVLGAARKDTLVIETSTIGPGQSRELSQRFAAKGVAYLDAPFSGGAEGARDGTLTIMVGGEAAAYERALPVLACLGTDLHHMGPSGAGNTMKLIIQMIFMSQVTAFLEGVALGETAGIEIGRLLDVIGTSSAHHPSIAKRYDKILAGDTTPRFEISSALKDLTLASAMGAGHGFETLITNAAIEAGERATALGLGDKDLIALRAGYGGGQDRGDG